MSTTVTGIEYIPSVVMPYVWSCARERGSIQLAFPVILLFTSHVYHATPAIASVVDERSNVTPDHSAIVYASSPLMLGAVLSMLNLTDVF